jgi:hypothetical protein
MPEELTMKKDVAASAADKNEIVVFSEISSIKTNNRQIRGIFQKKIVKFMAFLYIDIVKFVAK